ncbi:hypothetical protein [Tumebacillus flagellatus]|uniref:Uncharacterized protein n=1 Tax=Tumebacillus flagellatus TaxID=1157490 RepID=A0A074M7A8_9BACL|nr:hypothetical protein [Tumebacillus flagellatus]KEO81897.1 hypothetical protein EL26_18865 [Tumebacillus flagellatus]
MEQGMAHSNSAFRRMYAPDRLTLGMFLSTEAFDGDEKKRTDAERLIRFADDAALPWGELRGSGRASGA